MATVRWCGAKCRAVSVSFAGLLLILTPAFRLSHTRSHKSLLDYFQTQGFTGAFEALQKEAGQDGFVADPKAKVSGLLERKWTSVIRLQKKVSLRLVSLGGCRTSLRKQS